VLPDVAIALRPLICASPAPRTWKGVRLPQTRKTVGFLEEDRGFQIAREQKLKRGWPPFFSFLMDSAQLTPDFRDIRSWWSLLHRQLYEPPQYDVESHLPHSFAAHPPNPFPAYTEQDEWRQYQGVETYKKFAE
jgi:hypothetical protein